MAFNFFFMCSLLLFSLLLYVHPIYAEMKYLVHNTLPTHPGGIEFEKSIGIPYTKQIMKKCNDYLWTTIFKQTNLVDRKPVDTVEVFIKTLTRPGIAGETWDVYKINLDVNFFVIYNPNKFPLKKYFENLMLHEMAHVFQWHGEYTCPSGLTEGIADYAILRANITSYAPPGKGKQWDEGYAVTARFLEYCDGLVPDFTAKLNNMMRKTYDVSFFQNLTGKPVDVLWKEYKAKYPQVPPAAEWMQG